MGAALQPGLRGEAHMRVEIADTAAALGSGDVPVLGTPRVVALIEEAAVAAVRDALGAASTTVGVAVSIEHLAATTVGREVHAEATLRDVDGPALRFEVRAWDERGEVARGEHRRSVVDRERFLARAAGG
jgi:fluoroacetyl-CoA thioesterase